MIDIKWDIAGAEWSSYADHIDLDIGGDREDQAADREYAGEDGLPPSGRDGDLAEEEIYCDCQKGGAE